MTGDLEVAEMLMQKSMELNIELNGRDNNKGWTAFHWACFNGSSKIVEMLLQKSGNLNIDLTAIGNNGRTGFQLAKEYGRTEIVNLIRKLPSITL